MTRAELRTYVQDRLGLSTGDTAKNTQIQGLLNREYDRLVALNRLSLTSASLTYSSGNAVVSLPAGLRSVEGIYTPGGNLRPVSAAKLSDYEAAYSGSLAPSSPTFYALLTAPTTGAGSIRVWPAPTSSASDWRILYQANTTDMASDSDVPTLLPEPWHPLLAEMVAYRMAVSEESGEVAQMTERLVTAGMAELAAYARERVGWRPQRVRTQDMTAVSDPALQTAVGR